MAFALAFTLAACGSDAADSADESAGTTAIPSNADATATACQGPAATSVVSGADRVDLASGGVDRSYDRLVPTGYDGTPAPLVVDLHGYLSGAEGEEAMSEFAVAAEREGFVLATPQGNSELAYWNAVPHPDLPDDVGFVADVIDDVSADVCIDPDRVYVDGFSNGAFLASLIACELSDRVAAVAAVAGLLLPDGCDPSRPVPILAIHGTADRHVSFLGPPNPALADLDWNDESRRAFEGLPFAAVTESAAGWAELNGCDSEPERVEVSGTVDSIAYGGCADSAAVELYVVRGGGHTWPGSAFSHASAPILGATTDDIHATELLWDFFEAHPRG